MDRVFVIMGVSGSGKTTIGKLLAQELGIPFYDADDFHPQANIDKMASGRPLDDEDRWPWLDTLAQKIKQWEKNGGAVLACSALKEVYRERLFKDTSATSTTLVLSEVEGLSTGFAPARQSLSVGGKAKKNIIYLQADFETIKARLDQRENHFFNPKLLQSQFDALEEPEYGVAIDDLGQSREDILVQILIAVNKN